MLIIAYIKIISEKNLHSMHLVYILGALMAVADSSNIATTKDVGERKLQVSRF